MMKYWKQFVVIFCLIIFSCSKRESKNEWKEGKGYIKKEGIYSTTDNYQIIVDINNSLVTFIVKKGKDQLVYDSKYKMSSVHRWYFYYESNIIWIYSSDIGSSFIDLKSPEIKRKFITPDNKSQINIPEEIKGDILD